MPKISSAYRGPTIVMAVGTVFALVGSIPVAITFGMGTKTSATIIGVGFIGFGIFLILPGVFWCLVVQRRTYKYWIRRRRSRNKQEEKSALNGGPVVVCEEEEIPDNDHDLESQSDSVKLTGSKR